MTRFNGLGLCTIALVLTAGACASSRKIEPTLPAAKPLEEILNSKSGAEIRARWALLMSVQGPGSLGH